MRRRSLLLGAVAVTAVATATAATGVAFAGDGEAGTHGRPAVTVVAKDGRGDFTTVQAAIDAVPAGNTTRQLILITPGEYREVLSIPRTKPYLSLIGLAWRPDDVVVVYDRANGTPRPEGGTYGTSGSATVTVDGADFSAANLTFANDFDEAAHPEISGKQAVAVLTRADRLRFDRVRFLGNQDTLYLNSATAADVARVYLRDVYVEGDVDFIFGRATAVFERARIHSLDRGSTTNNGYVTAASTMISNPYGFLFTRSRFTSDAPAGTVYLGRPWHPSQDPNAIAQVLIRDSWIGDHVIAAAPWTDFSGGWSWRDARYSEYRNAGPGVVASADRPLLTAEQARTMTAEQYLSGTDGWHPHR